MISDKTFCIILLLLSFFIASISQILLKKAAITKYLRPIHEYINPWVISAYLIFITTTFMSVAAYKALPLSYGPVLESTSYIYVALWGALFFKEKITLKKAVALSLIIFGIIVYAL